MRQVRAIKSFESQYYGRIRAHDVFHCEPRHADDLERNGLIVTVNHEKGGLAPPITQAFARAPFPAEKEMTPVYPLQASVTGPAGPSAAGEVPLPSSLRAARASLKRTRPIADIEPGQS